MIASIVLIWMGFLGWRDYTTPGQLTHIRWKLTDASEQIKHPQYQSKVAVAFAKDENFEKATDSAHKIESSLDKAYALSAIAEAAANQENWGLALKATDKCTNPECEVDSLAKVLTVHGEQKNPELKEEE
jgi:hypothetical protein